MRFSKDKTKYYGFGKVGSIAHKVSGTWELGFHFFRSGGNAIFRCCYLRTKKAIYFFQYEWQIKDLGGRYVKSR